MLGQANWPLLTGMLLAGGSAAHALTLAEAGKAQAVTVTAADATPADRTVAAELAACLQKIAGAAFSAVPEAETGSARVLVGPSRAARQILGNETVDRRGLEESIVHSTGRDLLLAGGRSRGMLYAV